MPACGYEFYPLVFDSISHLFAALTREILSWTLEDKIHIHARSCNILYISFGCITLTVFANTQVRAIEQMWMRNVMSTSVRDLPLSHDHAICSQMLCKQHTQYSKIFHMLRSFYYKHIKSSLLNPVTIYSWSKYIIIMYNYYKKGKVYIGAKWLIRQELIPVSVAWSD